MPRDPYWKDGEEREIPETLGVGEGQGGCPKCGHPEAETDGVAVTGAGLSRYIDFQNREFTVVSCANCGDSEFYRRNREGDLLEFFFG